VSPENPITPELKRAYHDRTVCVTGGAGFIGSHLCQVLVEAGARVSVIDDLSSGTRENLGAAADRIRFIEGSILDLDALAEASAGADVVFHQAALTAVPGSVEQPVHYHEVNATGTVRVLEAARAAGVERFVYAASSSAYGDRGRTALDESLAPQPASPYAASKVAGELLLSAYAAVYGLSGVSLRYFNIFGPRQRPDSPYSAAIARFAAGMLRGERLTVYGDGMQTRDFTHVANAVRANLLAGACTQKLRGQVANVACGRSVSVLELIRVMASLLGVEPEYDHAPPRAGDVMHSQAHIESAARLLGYRPIVDLREGLQDTLAWYRHQYAPVGEVTNRR
jgi:UDP-glucose 4-epimerase